jgi:hypothetical protein
MSLKELSPPPLAQNPAAQEVLRVWAVADTSQEYVLQPTWNDPAAWGLMLVDIARHAARAYARAGQLTEQQVLERIYWGFNVEWRAPTDPGQQVHG